MQHYGKDILICESSEDVYEVRSNPAFWAESYNRHNAEDFIGILGPDFVFFKPALRNLFEFTSDEVEFILKDEGFLLD